MIIHEFILLCYILVREFLWLGLELVVFIVKLKHQQMKNVINFMVVNKN
jgi:hypothetical protein